jgi:hypothetical protein
MSPTLLARLSARRRQTVSDVIADRRGYPSLGVAPRSVRVSDYYCPLALVRKGF